MSTYIFVHFTKNVPSYIIYVVILINPLQIGTIALQYATSTVGLSTDVNLGLNLKV